MNSVHKLFYDWAFLNAQDKIIEYAFLEGGMSSEVLYFKTQNKQLVWKKSNEELPKLGLSAFNEYFILEKIIDQNFSPKPIAKAKFGYIQEFINGTIIDLKEFQSCAVSILSRIHKIKLNTWHNTISPISVIELYWNSLADSHKNTAIIKKKIFY
ncbi:hypothetical protein CF386_06260 [Paraphotobacterium marinum]|uniref:Aminoglycoside phosphotransferase domain-containing protein n=1 Tax=Paraphotobacterium marinum TaxID=1755811 RepID=A0A220VE14_9GAMM|nr:hypothetical protein [Paraphotobacterium marinum]ASK78634.1 hypothetical protein CF386_06260 [Paraphotobacterium marinum]